MDQTFKWNYSFLSCLKLSLPFDVRKIKNFCSSKDTIKSGDNQDLLHIIRKKTIQQKHEQELEQAYHDNKHMQRH